VGTGWGDCLVSINGVSSVVESVDVLCVKYGFMVTWEGKLCDVRRGLVWSTAKGERPKDVKELDLDSEVLASAKLK
jgi:hypothetical protein